MLPDMKRRDFLRNALSLVFLGGVTGCGSSRGHKSSGINADLQITNHTSNDLHVYIDGSHIGDVDTFDTDYFHVVSGLHTVEVREHNSLFYHVLGDYYFGSDRIRLHYH